MFQGTTIDELINSVERAEQKAQKQTVRQQQEETTRWSLHSFAQPRHQTQEFVEVA
jgi:hypothetical protein